MVWCPYHSLVIPEVKVLSSAMPWSMVPLLKFMTSLSYNLSTVGDKYVSLKSSLIIVSSSELNSCSPHRFGLCQWALLHLFAILTGGFCRRRCLFEGSEVEELCDCFIGGGRGGDGDRDRAENEVVDSVAGEVGTEMT